MWWSYWSLPSQTEGGRSIPGNIDVTMIPGQFALSQAHQARDATSEFVDDVDRGRGNPGSVVSRLQAGWPAQLVRQPARREY